LRILVASTFVPFIREDGSEAVNDLCDSLERRGHQVDTILLPFLADPLTTPQQLLALRLLDVTDDGDVLIAIRTPSYLLRHPRKVVWFSHHHRPAYDVRGPRHQNSADTPEELSLRRPIRQADDLGLREAGRLFAMSKVAAHRLHELNQLHADVLYPPLTESEIFSAGNYGDYVLCPSRITPAKRQQLLVDAMAHVRSGVRLVLVGPPGAPEDLLALERGIERLHVEDRVELRTGWISNRERRDLISSALACVYVPYDEDIDSHAIFEAFAARRPVITCTDSGETLELVEHGRSGLVVEPDPEHLAEAMDGLFADRTRAEELGRGGEDYLRAPELSWDRVVRQLLA
jgi:glycosyltransferase involved in cell wall biosynthesis